MKPFTPIVPELIGPVSLELGKSEHVRMVTLASGLTREDTSVDQKVCILLLLLIASNVVSDNGAPSQCHLRYLARAFPLDGHAFVLPSRV